MRGVIKLLFCSLFLLFYSTGFAAQLHESTGAIEVRRASPEKIRQYLSDPSFRYENDYTPKMSFWEAIRRWLTRHLFSPLIKGHDITLWEIIKYGIIIATIILVIYFLIKGDRIGLFYRGSRTSSIDILGAEEDINTMNFDKLIEDAINKKQYRTAIRYLYLKLLKDLSDNDLIIWRAEKTNRDYINELRPSVYGKLFREVTLLFDYAWYGDAAINENNFGQIKDSFTRFYHQLQTSA